MIAEWPNLLRATSFDILPYCVAEIGQQTRDKLEELITTKRMYVSRSNWSTTASVTVEVNVEEISM